MSRKRLHGSNGNISSLRGLGLIWLFILATLATGIWGPGGPRPAAANQPPSVDPATNTATYSEDQQPNPINPQVDVTTTPIYNVEVNNLTTNVGSLSTGTSISLTNTGADGSGANSQALSLNYTGGTYSLLGHNYGAYVNTTGGTGKSDGGAGGAGGTVNGSGVVTGVTIGASGAIQVSGIGIGGFSYGGAGGAGKEESSGHVTGGDGGAGGAGGIVQITNNGPITTTGASNSYGIYGQSVGGGGGTGGKASADVSCYGGTGGQGGAAGGVNITTNGVITTGDSYGIYAQSLGGGGGVGGEADAGGTQGWGGTGGAGGAGGSVTVTNNAAINTGEYLGAYGINAMSNGGSGGQGGEGKNGPQSNGGDGGDGGKGGAVTVNCNAAIDTAGLALAVNAASTGGTGGDGGGNNGNNGNADNGTGGNGGGSSLVSVNVAPGITLTGGIAAASIAGAGGEGSEGKDDGGGGGDGGVSGGVKVNCQGDIDLSTNICNINGIWAQSVSGDGGTGAKATGSGESYGGDGGNGGAGAAATVTYIGSITISGGYVHGILAQSWGGAGGAGGNSGHHPGDAGDSGAGGDVTVNLGGSIQTVGLSSYGILAQSLGGAGGNAGEGTKIITYSGDAGNGADGGGVTINTGSYVQGYVPGTNSSITTILDLSTAILAQSVGGGGGNGDSTSGVIFSVGGGAGSGGNGYTTINKVNTQVTVNNGSQIITQGFGAHGIQAQSVGGGGGNGGGTVTAGVGLSFAIGGSGGDGGDGGQVNVLTTGSSISTASAFAHGILAESLGGGGGNGGYAISAGAGVQISMGGSAGSGGDGGEVNVGSISGSGVITYCTSPITTTGFDAKGILAQSIGGGGGAGGYSIAAGLLSAPLAIGGSGGGGGSGGTVNVYNAGGIRTSQDLSQGILAQSVGGGGGNGGYSFAGNVTPLLSTSFSFGGKAGPGGNGEAVTVYNTGAIQTGSTITHQNDITEIRGVNAHGILAQSVGGSGGHGGWAGSGSASFSLGPDAPVSISMALSMGGTGGKGGDAGDVTVNNLAPTEDSSYISTLGDHAYGILAQSVGGGGGAGGGAAAATLSLSGSGSFSMSCPVAIGGSGGPGGEGGEVEVTNQNTIQTSGSNSLGILAQSISGGGGDGGQSLTGALTGTAGSVSFSPQITIGGDGGDGNTVTVTNTGAITTTGVSAIGIEAQSVGGSGGNGNWAFSGNCLLGSSTGFSANVTVGGTGGKGGSSSNVTVINGDRQNASLGEINTSGHLAPGILAQSIAGGGGNGGQSVSLNYSVKAGGAASESESKTSVTISPTFNVGGNGGSGGSNKDAQVSVTNYANISTTGARSYGIEAQCIGGSGGNGGGVFTLALGPDLTEQEAQNADPPATNLGCQVTVGGNGGKGGDAGTVQVTNSGAITTQGAYSYGIFAQSVGGGGGAGGSINDLAIVEALSKVINHSPSNDLNHSETISVGGQGGAAGDGNAVTVTNCGAIGTSGDFAHGIFAQSVGGGGGDGGVPTLGLTVPSGDWSDWQTWLIPSEGLSFEVGGKGGAAGDGNTVTVTNSGAITTSGIMAMGIYAQSVGGGGGVASYDQSDGSSGTGTNLLPGAIAIGGKGGSAGDGGEIIVTNSGVIQTGGRGACGIYAQSIGGGGGNASVMGGPWEGISWLQYFGFGINIGSGGGDGGNGGAVNVTSTGDIITTGNNANGIFAQSIGGQGGAGSVITQISQGFLWNGSTAAGVAGDGGTVTVSQTGNITTYGNDAHGIVAQSSAGKDTAGNVTVTLNDPNNLTATPGNIAANGLGAIGIAAQSLGAGGNGTIQVFINQPSANTGLVQGGQSKTVTNPDGSTTAYQAYGVLIMDGSDNLVKNCGSISTLDGLTGTAIVQQTSYGAPSRANLTIDNYGAITGSVTPEDQAASPLSQDQTDPFNSLKLPGGQSVITFNNYQGGTYNAGPAINLGGGTLTNSGVLSLGTVQSILTGNFINYDAAAGLAGTLQTTVNGNGTIGQLNVSGTAQLGGTLQVLTGTGPFKDGNSSSFLTAAGGISGTFSNLILPASTSLVNFTLNYTGAPSGSQDLQAAAAANALQVVSHVNSYTTVASRTTERSLGWVLDQMLASNATGDLARILAEFQNLTPSQFGAAFQSLDPRIYGANTDTTFAITRQYNRTLQQRLEVLRSFRAAEAGSRAVSPRPLPLLAYNGSNADLGKMLGQGQDGSPGSDGRLGVWLEGFGQWGNQAAVDGASGYNYGLTGTGFGVDYAFNQNLILGANFGYSYCSLNLDNGFGAGRINSLYGSLYGTYFTERFYVEGILGYGNHQYDNSRQVSIGALQSGNQSSHTGNAFSVLAEGGYKLPVQQCNLQPFASISFCNLSEGRVEESGGVARMQISSRSTNSVVSELGVRVDKPIQIAKGTLVPMLKASWQHDFGASQNNQPLAFVGSPVGVTITNPRVSQDSAVIKAGLSFKSKGGITSSIQYMGEVGDQSQNHGVVGQVRIAF